MAVIADNHQTNHAANQQAVNNAKAGMNMHPAVAAAIANANGRTNTYSPMNNSNGNNNASNITRSFGSGDTSDMA